jgi:glutathione S-transferase
MIKIYGRASSYNVQKVMWLIGELSLPHVRIDVGGKFGGLDATEFLAKNPNGKIPVIEDDGFVLWESNAIVRYLAAKYAAGTWCPSDPTVRARADQWMTWASGELHAGFMGIFWGYWRTRESKRDWTAIKASQDQCSREFTLLDRILVEQPNLSGDRLTMGDIPAAAMLYRYFTMGLEIPHLPNVEAWYARLSQRRAYREHVMVSYEDLRGTI